MANEQVQFNAAIPDALAQKVKEEAVKNRITLGEFTSKAFEKLLSLPAAQRRFLFEEFTAKKIRGRKIAAKKT